MGMDRLMKVLAERGHHQETSNEHDRAQSRQDQERNVPAIQLAQL